MDNFMRVLFLGGTGTISTACVRVALDLGFEVFILNRGQSLRRPVDPRAYQIIGDAYNDADLSKAVIDNKIEVVADFICFDGPSAQRMVNLLNGKVKQYLFIATASAYQKPIHKLPITESTPLSKTGLSGYSQLKIDAENIFISAYLQNEFPVVIVRPSHTYDDAIPPLIGDWTAWERVLSEKPIFISGDGTNPWTLTHADDFAVGFVGLIGNFAALGEGIHIVSNESPTWEEIYATIGSVVGVKPNIVKLTAEQFKMIEPDWFWSEQNLGDLSHAAIFDNTKIKRFVPAFNPIITWPEGARRLNAWYLKNKSKIVLDEVLSNKLNRVATAHSKIMELLKEH
jgi:nucleoside-diphosphate-sugar epimerase